MANKWMRNQRPEARWSKMLISEKWKQRRDASPKDKRVIRPWVVSEFGPFGRQDEEEGRWC